MPASDRDPVKPSQAQQPGPRTHVSQSKLHAAAHKTNTTTGRDPVRQIKPSK
jgi:hypothetical protein